MKAADVVFVDPPPINEEEPDAILPLPPKTEARPPDAPLESGTAIYRNKESKVFMLDRNDPKTDYNSSAEDINEVDKWEPIIQVSNIFNRLVIYRGEYYHRSMLPGFGDSKYNGRLFQTFFFNEEV